MDRRGSRAGVSPLRRTVGAVTAVGLAAAAAAAVTTGAGTAAAASYGCALSGPLMTCGYVGVSGEFELVVPSGVTSMHVEAIGGSGVNVGASGGRGGVVEGDLAVTPGDTLYIRVNADAVGNGGGASSVSTASVEADRADGLASRILVAPGGGGATTSGAGGDAGVDAPGSGGGKAGGTTTGGAGGTGASAGDLAVGGEGAGTGGAGGAGLYGGGGGASGFGGGGGSYLVPAGSTTRLADLGTTPAVRFTFLVGLDLLPDLGSSDGLGSLSGGSSTGSLADMFAS